MDVATAIRTKRMVRSFSARRLEAPLLERILDAGRHAPSSKNTQRWDFIVVDDRDLLGRLAEVGRYAGHLAGAATAVALVIPDPHRGDGRQSLLWDLGLAAENMMLAAWELGVGSCPATVYDQDLARELLGYPDDRWCGWLLSFGYPADPDDLTRPPRKGRRKGLSEIVHHGRW